MVPLGKKPAPRVRTLVVIAVATLICTVFYFADVELGAPAVLAVVAITGGVCEAAFALFAFATRSRTAKP